MATTNVPRGDSDQRSDQSKPTSREQADANRDERDSRVRQEADKAKDGPNIPYNRVDAKSPEDQRKAEEEADRRLQEAKKRDEEKRREDKIDQNVKSSQSPISEDRTSSHPADVKREPGASAAQQVRENERGEQQTGRGTSSLNQGPSDTTSRDPHNPPNYPQGQQEQADALKTGGTGQAPPSGPRPGTTPGTTEKPSM